MTINYGKLECLTATGISSLVQGILKGEVSLYYWHPVWLVLITNKNKNCQLSYSWFRTSQTEGQRYSDTSPFSIPCLVLYLWAWQGVQWAAVVTMLLTYSYNSIIQLKWQLSNQNILISSYRSLKTTASSIFLSYHILLSIVCTFLQRKLWWNFACALYLAGT